MEEVVASVTVTALAELRDRGDDSSAALSLATRLARSCQWMPILGVCHQPCWGDWGL